MSTDSDCLFKRILEVRMRCMVYLSLQPQVMKFDPAPGNTAVHR